jgi:hypothetical protein
VKDSAGARSQSVMSWTPTAVLRAARGARAAALASLSVLGCGSQGSPESGGVLDVGGGTFQGSGSDAEGPGYLDAYIEQGQVAVKIITLRCAGACADVEAVATGGTPPYAYVWDNGSTDPTRHLCPTSDASFHVQVTDTGTTGEFTQAAQTVQVPLTTQVFACPDAAAPGGDAAAEASDGTLLASVTVPGTTDIWLAGQPDGSTLMYTNQTDTAPTDSPVEVPVAAGTTLTFSATGSTSYTGGICSAPSPDGGCLVTVNAGPANGISSVVVLADALIGVFTGPGAPGGTAPAGLDFSTNTSFATLSPLVDQVFFIGDGLTGTGSGAVQQFVVPSGATRLFLASSDDLGASYNNSGQFQVMVSVLP